jgi:hypothetical protein
MDLPGLRTLKRQLMDASDDVANAQAVLNGKRSSPAPFQVGLRLTAHSAYVDHLPTHVNASPSDLH